ncbi:14032_t:CDS:1, partial [Gigaspora margarita]
MIKTKQARYGLSKQGNDLLEEDREQRSQHTHQTFSKHTKTDTTPKKK